MTWRFIFLLLDNILFTMIIAVVVIHFLVGKIAILARLKVGEESCVWFSKRGSSGKSYCSARSLKGILLTLYLR